MTFFVLLIAAYLLGATPFGLLIGLARGVDIRDTGSGNIGATNAGRALGRTWGYVCLLLDVGKGLAAVVVARSFLLPQPPDAASLAQWLSVGVAAVLGHVFPIYLGFRGGKGVATTVGVALGIYPYYTIPMLGALGGYALVRFALGWVSLASLTIALLFPLLVYAYMLYEGLALGRAWPLLTVALALAALIIVRHRGNIQRLLRGEELNVRSRTG